MSFDGNEIKILVHGLYFLQQETQDQLFVQWSKDTEYSGKAATLHVLVIHAMIVLLTYGEPQG